MKSPLSVTYDDVIKEEQRRLALMKITYPAKVAAGAMPSWTAQHRIAIAELLVRLLKRHKKDPQMNLNDAFDRLQSVKKAHPMPAAPKSSAVDDPDFYHDLDPY